MMRFILLFLTSSPLWASFNGSYSGGGQAIFASGTKYECTEIFLRLESDHKLFRLSEGGYICGLLQAGFDSFKMTIKDGELWHEEQRLGTITDQDLSYQIYDPADGSTYNLRLKRMDSSHIHYYEQWHDGEKIALTIKGILKSK
jgi:hypothetical protein